MFGNLGMGEMLLVLLVVLLLFGARRLPELGGALGKGLREFRRSVAHGDADDVPAVARPPAEASPETRERTKEGRA